MLRIYALPTTVVGNGVDHGGCPTNYVGDGLVGDTASDGEEGCCCMVFLVVGGYPTTSTVEG